VQEIRLLFDTTWALENAPLIFRVLFFQFCGNFAFRQKKEEKERKKKTAQAAIPSLHQLRKRRPIGPKCRESPSLNRQGMLPMQDVFYFTCAGYCQG